MYKKRGFLLTVILAVFLLMPFLAQARKATPIDSWTKRNLYNVAAILNSVADNGADTYVAVGNAGVILNSTDGINWTVRTDTSMVRNLRGVAYGALPGAGAFKGFIAVGDTKQVQRSLNGTTWSPSGITGITGNPKAITFGNNLFVIVADGGRIFTSPDSLTWTQQAVGLFAETFLSVIYANGRFTAVGGGGRVAVSYDGFYWEKHLVPAGGTLQDIAFGTPLGWSTGLYVAVNSAATVFVSPDGLSTWMPFKVAVTGIASGNLFSVTYAQNGLPTGGFFAIVGNKGYIYVSDDGFMWGPSGVPTRPGTNPPASITTNMLAIGNSNNGTLFYAVGQSGTILTSPDLKEWRYRSTSNPTGFLPGVAFGNNIFVTAGQYGNIFTSSDGGSIWAESRLTNDDLSYPYIESIAFGNNRFVAVGRADALNTLTSVPAIYTSDDGLTWTQRSSETQDFGQLIVTDDLYGVAYGEVPTPLYVAVGQTGNIVTSPDGIIWTFRNSGTTNDLIGVTFESSTGTFVAVGNKGTIITSTNGQTWTPQSVGTTVPNFQSVTSGAPSGLPNRVVAVASNGNVYWAPASSLGSWTKAATTLTAVYGVAYGSNGGTFIGFVTVGNGGAIWQSLDGNTWTRAAGTATTAGLLGVAFGNNTFVATGSSSTIISKTP